jgi:hypothetical protein
MTILPKTEDFSFLKPTCHVELTQWYSLWKSKEPKDRPSTIPATLKEYNEVLLSNVSTILLIWTVLRNLQLSFVCSLLCLYGCALRPKK